MEAKAKRSTSGLTPPHHWHLLEVLSIRWTFSSFIKWTFVTFPGFYSVRLVSIWQLNLCRYLTITSVCGPSPKLCHKVGSTQLSMSRIVLKCCSITISLQWGSIMFQHDGGPVHKPWKHGFPRLVWKILHRILTSVVIINEEDLNTQSLDPSLTCCCRFIFISVPLRQVLYGCSTQKGSKNELK